MHGCLALIQPSAASSNLVLVTGPGPDNRARGEAAFGLDPVQPRGAPRKEHPLDVAGGGPAGDLGALVRGEVVQDHVQRACWPALAGQLEEGQELPPPLALADPV